MIISNTLDLINKTPLLLLDKITEFQVNLYGKLEYLQPGGSVKDRAAYQIVKDAYDTSRLKEGQTVIEMTSGNMGAGLAVVCKQFGNPFIAVMPEGNSPERVKILKALGAEVLLSKQIDGKPGRVTGKDIEYASKVAIQLAQDKDGYYVDQFKNPSSIKTHYNNTGPEIWTDLPQVDAFVASIGTGGTFIGTSRFLKSKNKQIKCIAVEPHNATILKTGEVKDSKHIIQGTGYGLVPPHWNEELADEIISVSDKEVKEFTRRLSEHQGLFVGYSSGANVAASLKYLKMNKKIKNLVTILCDTGYKYSDL